MVLLSGGILPAPQATIDIPTIPAIFTSLWLLTKLRDDGAGTSFDNTNVRFNNDSGANYFKMSMQGFNTTVSATNQTTQTQFSGMLCAEGGVGSGIFATSELMIPYYTDAQAKTFNSKNGLVTNGTAANWITQIVSGLWNSTAVISRITLLPGGGSNFATGSAYSLYGLT